MSINLPWSIFEHNCSQENADASQKCIAVLIALVLLTQTQHLFSRDSML